MRFCADKTGMFFALHNERKGGENCNLWVAFVDSLNCISAKLQLVEFSVLAVSPLLSSILPWSFYRALTQISRGFAVEGGEIYAALKAVISKRKGYITRARSLVNVSAR